MRTDRFPGRVLADRKERKLVSLNRTIGVGRVGEENFQAQILYQNGHGHEHVRVDRQQQILECRSV